MSTPQDVIAAELASRAGAAAPASANEGDDSIAALLAQEAAGRKTNPSPADAPEGSQTPWMDLAKGIGSAAVRPIATALAALPTTAMDAGLQARNFIANPHVPSLSELNPFSAQGRSTGQYPSQSDLFRQTLNKYTGAPQTGVGQGAEALSTMLAGSMLPMPQASTWGGRVAPQANAIPQQAQSGLTAAQQQAMQGGQGIGMQTTPGQAAGSVPMQQAEAWAQSHPWTSGPFEKIASNNRGVLARQAAASIGEDAPNVDSTVLARANERLGDVFQSVRDPSITVPVDPKQTTAALDTIDDSVKGLLPGNGSVRDNPLVSNLEGLSSTGQINAQQLGSLSSKLGRAAYKQMSGPSGDRDMGQALYAVKDHVDDLVQSSLDTDEAATYNAARTQYRNLMMLTSRTNIVNPSTGEVSGVALANKLQQSDKAGFLYGKNQTPLYQAARFAQAFKPLVGNSGTATRSSLGGATDWLASVPANMAARFYLSSPGAALARSAAAFPGLMGASTGTLMRSPGPGVGLLAAPQD